MSFHFIESRYPTNNININLDNNILYSDIIMDTNKDKKISEVALKKNKQSDIKKYDAMLIFFIILIIIFLSWCVYIYTRSITQQEQLISNIHISSDHDYGTGFIKFYQNNV